MAKSRSTDGLAVPTSLSRPRVRIIHFNDVYNIKADTRDPVGGIARFETVLRKYRSMQPPALTLFSGDALNPSLESIYTKGQFHDNSEAVKLIRSGEHMMEALNMIGVNVACLGVCSRVPIS